MPGERTVAGDRSQALRRAWITRLAVLVLLATVKVLIIGWDLENPPEGRPVFSEGAAIEHFQAALLAIAGLLALSAGRWGRASALRGLLGILFAGFVIRELDEDLDRLIADGAWQILVTCLLVAGAWQAWRLRHQLFRAADAFCNSAAGGFFVSGILILLFSRFFGMSDLWWSIMGEAGFQRGVKNAVEEVIESAGCILLVIAMLEFRLGISLEAVDDRSLGNGRGRVAEPDELRQ